MPLFGVLTLGTLASTAARELARFDNDVSGVDIAERRGAPHAQDLGQTLIFSDAREDGALKEAGLEPVDLGLGAIGGDIEASMLSVTDLKILGAETIWATDAGVFSRNPNNARGALSRR